MGDLGSGNGVEEAEEKPLLLVTPPPDRQSMKQVLDNIHGNIQLDPVCLRFVDTEQFQRGVPGSKKSWLGGWQSKRIKNSYRQGFVMWSLAFLWMVWKERNARIFLRKERSARDLLGDIYYNFSLWTGATAGRKRNRIEKFPVQSRERAIQLDDSSEEESDKDEHDVGSESSTAG